jgi:HPt (histidine-containing phosphotransfer) domain-containing protein
MIAIMGVEVTGQIASSLELEGAENIKALRMAVSIDDASSAEREAHTLASSCLSLGLASVGTLLRQIETDIRKGDLPSKSTVELAESLFGDGLSQLRSHLSSIAASEER